jgi:hypothetical protein
VKNKMSLGSRFLRDDVGFKRFCGQNEDIVGVAMLDQNRIINLRTSNGFSVSRVFKGGKYIKNVRDIYIG